MHRYTCLLFDLGGVLVRNAGPERLNAMLDRPLPIGELKEVLLSSPSYRAFELGLTLPETFASNIVEELHLKCSPEDFIAEFKTWPQGFYPGVTELLEQLRKRYKVACLSNSNALHWDGLGGIKEHFDTALSSHQLKAIKPDKAAFDLALQACGTAAKNAFFFDDTLSNVEAARACGIMAGQVCGIEEVRAKVHALGLLAE